MILVAIQGLMVKNIDISMFLANKASTAISQSPIPSSINLKQLIFSSILIEDKLRVSDFPMQDEVVNSITLHPADAGRNLVIVDDLVLDNLFALLAFLKVGLVVDWGNEPFGAVLDFNSLDILGQLGT